MATAACWRIRRPAGWSIDMSTIAPDAVRRMHADLARAGVAFVDAPVSGGPLGAKNATLSIMAGGDAAGVRQGAAVLRRHGHHHHPRGRERRRPDRQAVQPAHLRHQHPGHLRGAGAGPRRGRRPAAIAHGAAGRLGRLVDAGQAGPGDDRRRRVGGLPHRPDAQGPAAGAAAGPGPERAVAGHRAGHHPVPGRPRPRRGQQRQPGAVPRLRPHDGPGAAVQGRAR